ncbi:hypothetical protein [Halorarum salinum]|uniref:Uncharacterized protein n=1 Tax=Halorarum salinum TaxID=2743089 RepID=A0A7D5QKD2_9EURY|nr:hypothetical protein [Halobaculum salinum]QLG62065.1 hypothetical protein HUG12_10130 [Halobaculum salinum]
MSEPAELEEVIAALEDVLDGEELERAKLFIHHLFAFREQALERFIEEEMAGKISEVGRWMFLKGFDAGTNGFEYALEEISPELKAIGEHVDALFEGGSG